MNSKTWSIATALMAALAALTCTAAPAPGLEVTVEGGTVRGVERQDLRLFRNIPYAAAPVGALRWRPPEAPKPWQGVRDASDFGAYCPQNMGPDRAQELAGYPMSEDCLTVNLWMPAKSTSRRLPVMVWLTPGAFRQGAPQMKRYDASALARQGVIVVTFGYRLGILGQFAHPALSRAQSSEALGNYGLMDTLALLQWVKHNIAAFGGDPGNVTLFGMSSGGVAVNYLMSLQASDGLFQKAISESSAIRVSAPRRLAEDVNGVKSLEADGLALARHFGLDAADDKIVPALRALRVDQILEYQGNPRLFNPGSLNPVVDGKLVVSSVGDVFRAGREQPVPYISGATTWEGSLLSFMPTAGPVLAQLNISRADAARIYGEVDDRTLINNLEFDLFFGSQRYLAKQHAKAGHPAWLYVFSRVLDAERGKVPGASHGAEAAYVFQVLDTIKPPPNAKTSGFTLSAADRTYAKMVSATWIRFAKHGDPNGPGLPLWPTFTGTRDALLDFGQEKPAVREHFEPVRMQYFENLFETGKM